MFSSDFITEITPFIWQYEEEKRLLTPHAITSDSYSLGLNGIWNYFGASFAWIVQNVEGN